MVTWPGRLALKRKRPGYGWLEYTGCAPILYYTLHRFPSLPATTFIALTRNVTFQKHHGQATGNIVSCWPFCGLGRLCHSFGCPRCDIVLKTHSKSKQFLVASSLKTARMPVKVDGDKSLAGHFPTVNCFQFRDGMENDLVSNLFRWSFSACMVTKHFVRDPWSLKNASVRMPRLASS